MCRGIQCFMAMSGHGHEVGSISDLAALLARMSGNPEAEEPETYEEAVAAAVKGFETEIRGLETAINILKAEPPEEGAKLAMLEMLKPYNPDKHGVASVATYQLPDESYLVIGTDHLTGLKVTHTTPNLHGLKGLQRAVVAEMEKAVDKAEEAEKAATPAEQPEGTTV